MIGPFVFTSHDSYLCQPMESKITQILNLKCFFSSLNFVNYFEQQWIKYLIRTEKFKESFAQSNFAINISFKGNNFNFIGVNHKLGI